MASPAAALASDSPALFDEGLAAAASDSAREDQQLYEAQAALISAEQSTRPLIGPLESLSQLEGEYAGNPRFLTKIQAAARGDYPRFRRVRGDGSCFYRAYIFGILDWMSRTLRSDTATEQEKQQVQDVAKVVEESLPGLLALGYESFTMEDFWETFNDQFAWVVELRPSSDELVERFQDEGLGQYLVSYARYLTSGYMAQHKDEYAPFVPEGRSVEEFRRAEIEPMGRECEHLQIVCLSSLLRVGVVVAYLDQSDGEAGIMRTYTFPEGAVPKVHLLYRQPLLSIPLTFGRITIEPKEL